jgi:hypothetical protein
VSVQHLEPAVRRFSLRGDDFKAAVTALERRTGLTRAALVKAGRRPGVVRISGTYGGPWRTLRIVTLDRAGGYTARIDLARRGLFHLRVLYPDGSRAVGSLRVR